MLLLSSRPAAPAARLLRSNPRTLAAVAPPRAFVRGSGGGAPPSSSDSGNTPAPPPAAPKPATPPPASADPAAAAKALAAAAAVTPAKPAKAPRRRTTTKRAPTDDNDGSSSSSPSRGRSTSPGGTRRTRTKTATADGEGPKRQRARSRSPASPTAAAAASAAQDAPAATAATTTPKPPAEKKKSTANNTKNVIPVGFLTKRRVQFGLELAVVGESDALGAWDPSLAVPLRWCDGDVWVGSAAVPAPAEGAVVAYKYIVRAADGTVVQWQPSDNRVLELSADRAALERALADAPQRAVPDEAKGVLAGVAVAVEDEFDGDRHQLVKCV